MNFAGAAINDQRIRACDNITADAENLQDRQHIFGIINGVRELV